jgi:hypothetical protein
MSISCSRSGPAGSSRDPRAGQGIVKWLRPSNVPTAGRCMKLRTRKSRPTINIRRTVKSAGNRWTPQTAQAFRATNSSRCQMARMFDRQLCQNDRAPSDSTHDAPETAALRYFSHLYVRLGHTRPFSDAGSMSGLAPESGRRSALLRFANVLHEQTFSSVWQAASPPCERIQQRVATQD